MKFLMKKITSPHLYGNLDKQRESKLHQVTSPMSMNTYSLIKKKLGNSLRVLKGTERAIKIQIMIQEAIGRNILWI